MDKNKIERVKFCLSLIRSNGLFGDMYDHVHIDEKWFFLSKTKRNYYLLAEEPIPDWKCKSKRYIDKVMFMAAVARPRWIAHSKKWFDGLIGIWPYVKKEPALRNSKNRAKGTLVTKNIQSVNNQQHQIMMEQNVIPAIKEKWPDGHKTIYIQQDNAKPHSASCDNKLQESALEDGWDIQLKRQPPNSPDLNVLDLGFFASIQSLQHQDSPSNIDELIESVQKAFASQKREAADNIFLSLQQAMTGVLTVRGDNTYKLNHMGKDKLRRAGLLPVSIQCDAEIIADSRELLDSNNAI